jgi:hypothetical protein
MGALIKTWDAPGGNFCQLHVSHFIIGRSNGPWDDNAGQCTNVEFMTGTFQKEVQSTFGKDVLNEIILLIKNSGENPIVIEERTKAYQIAELWKQIPINPDLKTTLENYDERGYDYYYKKEDYFIYFPQHGLEISNNGIAHLTNKNKKVILSFSCSAAIFMDGYFYLAGNEMSILDSEGNLILDSFSSHKEFKRDENIKLPFKYMKSLELGDRIRLIDLYRKGKTVVCYYDNYFYENSPEVIKTVAGQKGLLEITPLGIMSRLVLK